jgi:hypothetical protein
MSSVMIRCPNTGLAVSTQIEMESAVFRKLAKMAARMTCAACGQEHVWMTSAGWLDDEDKPIEENRPVLRRIV